MRPSTLPAVACQAAAAGFLLVACSSAPERSPVPRGRSEQAIVPGMPDVRVWGDVRLEGDELEQRAERARATLETLKANLPQGEELRLRWLAMSGGAADGAFGAGLLVGWTEEGTRPRFDLVTGVSTGALSAPFAFLGSDYDALLERFYTEVREEQLFESRSLLSMLGSTSAADTAPLRELLDELIDAELLAAVAREHARGRRLIVATTHLDAQRPMLWDLGAIATVGTPQALELFKDAMLASAAVPGLFPPVLIPVQVDGRPYDEMHVDGGVTNQVALLPETFELRAMLADEDAELEVDVYVIRNARTTPEYRAVEPKLIEIAGRSAMTLTKTQGVGDLYRIFLYCLRDDYGFHLASVPAEFDAPRESEFDQVYMRSLFQRGRAMALQGFPWAAAPPPFEPDQFGRAAAARE